MWVRAKSARLLSNKIGQNASFCLSITVIIVFHVTNRD
jgi:hypothetical protein